MILTMPKYHENLLRESPLSSFSMVNFLSSLETKKILKISNETFSRITRYQVFIFLQYQLHFLLHFFFSFMGNFFVNDPISPDLQITPVKSLLKISSTSSFWQRQPARGTGNFKHGFLSKPVILRNTSENQL